MTKLWVSFIIIRPIKKTPQKKGAFVWGLVPAESNLAAVEKFQSTLKARGFNVVDAEVESFQSKLRREKQSGLRPSKTIVRLAHQAARTKKVQLGDYYIWEHE